MQIDTFDKATELRNKINHYSRVIDILAYTQCKSACLAAVTDSQRLSPHTISYIELPAELYNDMITVINERMIALEKQFEELQ